MTDTDRPAAARDAAFLERLAGAPASETRRLLCDYVCAQVADFLDFEAADGEVGPHDQFLELGFDSLLAVDFKIRLEERLDCRLQSTVLFDCATPDALVAYLTDVLSGATRTAPAPRLTPRRPDTLADTDIEALDAEQLRALVRKQSARLRAHDEAASEPIAIVGMACRMPGHANTPEEFWQLQLNGVDAIAEIPASRWDVNAFYDADRDVPGRMYTRVGGFIDRVGEFDAGFFNISPREATQLDPQQRVLMEVVWEALERAGLSADRLQGSPTGVFIGTRGAEYYQAANPEDIETYYATGNSSSAMAGRLSYFLGLTGPCFAVDTACSSSLVALHAAAQSLRKGECSAAIAGGVNLLLDPIGNIAISKASMLSPNGRCATFDAEADGYARSEAVGVVVLKRLSRAQADGDHVLAVIRGSAINQDGASGGLTVPSGAAQQVVIRQALANAGVSPGDIGYMEAHGTGTSLGDPIEVAALDAVFGPGRDRERHPLMIGSVKTNIGHAEPAAGIAGLIKVVQILEHGVIPPHLHLNEPNPHIPWDETIVRVPRSATPWPRGERPRMAGVSSYGFGGSNAHVILAEAPAAPQRERSASRPAELFAISARSENGLRDLVTRYREQLESPVATSSTDSAKLGTDTGSASDDAARAATTLADTPLVDLCASAATGRAQLPHRLALVVESHADLAEQLAQFGSHASHGWSGRAPAHAPKIGFLFTGQGSQYAGMANELYHTQAVFRAELERCEELLAPHLQHSLRDVLWGEHSALLSRTDFTQPCLFALEYALAKLWASWGVHPTWVAGHSVGEYAAACLAGVFSLDDACKLIAARGRLMVERTEPGAMAVIFASMDLVRRHVPAADPELSIAAYNGPWSLVISGKSERVKAVTDALSADGLDCRTLDVSHAFHSPLMDPMLDEFAAVANSVEFHVPTLGFVSNLQAGITPHELAQADYWVRHVREPVRFADGINALAREHCDILIEIGPSPTLIGMAQSVASDTGTLWLPSLRKGHGDWATLLASLGELFVHGAPLDWRGFHADDGARKVLLPTYPFQRSRYWLERKARVAQAGNATGHRLLGGRISSSTLQPGQVLFESTVREDDPALFADHRAYDTAILPAAAFLECALAAGRHVSGSEQLELRDVVIEAALALDDVDTKLQTLLTPTEPGAWEFKLFSARDDADAWTPHVTGTIARGKATHGADADANADTVSLDALRERCAGSVDTNGLYDRYAAIGLSYGPAFRGLQSLARGEGEALGHVVLPEAAGAARGFLAHPALLDGCFQTCLTLALQRGLDGMYLPVSYERVLLHAPLGSEVFCHVRLRSVSDDARVLVQDLELRDDNGALVARLDGLSLVQASQAALSSAADPLKTLGHSVSWSPRAHTAELPDAPDTLTGEWLLLADDGGVAEALADRLRALGATPRLLRRGQVRDDNWDAVLDASTEPLAAVLHLWALDASSAPASDAARQHELCGSALGLAGALARREAGAAPQIAFITRGAVPASDTPAPLAVDQSTLWGLGAVFALEHPEWRTRRLDLDPLAARESAVAAGESNDTAADSANDAGEGTAAELDALLLELTTPDDETQVAWRNGTRRVARLTRTSARARRALALPGETWQLRVSEYGVLENLNAFAAPRRAPEHGEVEIEVAATALNFKDVLTALGMLREQAEAAGILSAPQQPLGLECAGKVVAVGEGVTHFAIGDAVVASTLGAMASHVTLPASAVFAKPDSVNMTDAAALPTVFLTALYGLENCAQIRAGDKVLIHAAAGGVGQAAIQLAQRAGAEVFATASPGKWEHLRAQGVQHVMNSRTLDFADEVLALTEGRGVDIVLNSLNGEHIPSSLRCLAEGGRFIEIGKLGIWSPEQVSAERADVEYHAFDMVDVTLADPQLLSALQSSLCTGLDDGSLRPPPVKVFPVTEAVSAFSWLAQAKNIGKVVLSVPAPGARSLPVRDDRNYLITGGLGALGLSVARFLADAGARALTLCARSEPSPEAQAAIDTLRTEGVDVRTARVDVTDRAALEALLHDLSPALGGVVHAAGVLQDGMLMNLDWERFARVLAPKLEGAWNLHELTQSQPLDFFVCFSSMVGVLGNAGQGNYAAANAFLDALAWHRRALDLPALSIDWGPWSGAGMASESAARNRARFAEIGLGSLSHDQGLAVFERLLADSTHTQVAVLPITWPRFLARMAQAPPFYEALQSAAAPSLASGVSLLDELAGATPEEMSKRLMDFLREQLAFVMGFASPNQVDPQLELVEMGIDSLLAVDLRNRVEASLGVSLPATLLFDHPNLSSLATSLTELLQQSSSDDDELLAEIEELSDDEVMRLLSGEQDD
ncbi:MAG: polyketide synthase [Planctomycetota bacterium]|nr:MAG: polyketide synthase [Planctomycetota bacterium]